MDGIVVYDLNSKTSEMVKKEPLPFVPFEEESPSLEKKINNADDVDDDGEDGPAHERDSDNKKDEETT